MAMDYLAVLAQTLLHIVESRTAAEVPGPPSAPPL
jgi:hypothetical protein